MNPLRVCPVFAEISFEHGKNFLNPSLLVYKLPRISCLTELYLSVLYHFAWRKVDIMYWWVVVSKILITVFNSMPHILINFSGLSDGKKFASTGITVQYMSSSSFLSFTVLLNWFKIEVSKIMAIRLNYDSSSEIRSVPSNDTRTDSIFWGELQS